MDPETPALPKKDFKKARIFVAALAIVLVLLAMIVYKKVFSAPERQSATQEFVVKQGADTADVLSELKSQGFIRSIAGMRFVLFLRGHGAAIVPGGYEISKSVGEWSIGAILRRAPHEVWVVIPEGLRKEEVGAILGSKLGWTAAQENEWVTVDTNQSPDYFEGVYFPDTYLIPIGESPADAATRLRAQFEEEFAPYAAEALSENMKWTTALKVASLIQREAGGSADMPIISGIIWNRLAAGMPLQIDASVQYARGDTPTGWWAPIKPADESIDSPYNTYIYKGLPPTPIDDPGLEAIKAALEPSDTTCLYYLHDSSGMIHCSDTYAGQLANIATYLK